MSAVSDAVQAAVREEPGVQFALNGFLVIETIDEGDAEPVLHHYTIGDPTPWAKLGMMQAALRSVERDLDSGFISEEDE